MAAPGFRRGTPPPFPWPALWAQVAAQGSEAYGQRWLVPRGATAPPPVALPATADPARHLVFARGEAEEELEHAALDEDSDDADSEEGEGGTSTGEGEGSGSLDALSLHLDGEGEIVVTDEWRDRLARAAVKHAQRIAAADPTEAREDASEDSREDAQQDARQGPLDALGDSGGVAAQEAAAAAAAASGPAVSSPARPVPAGGVAVKAAEAPYDRFLRGKYGPEQARRFAVQEAALSAALASRGGGQHSGLAYWPK
jgi:hypothetical protein